MPEISPNTRRCLIMVRQRRVLVLDIFLCTYRLNTATQQVGTWMAVKVRGRLDALPPAFTRGVPPVRRPGGGGSTNSRQQSVKQNSLSVFAVLISHSFFERYTGDGLPPIPVCALVSPPSQVRGARTRTASGRAPLDKQLCKSQFYALLSKTVKPIFTFCDWVQVCGCVPIPASHREASSPQSR